MLKLYPIASALALVRKAKRSKVLFCLALSAEVIFLVASLSNLRLVARATPQTFWQSFGYPTAFLLASTRFGPLAWPTKLMLPTLLAVSATSAYFTYRTRQYWLNILKSGDEKSRPLFIAGGAIYLHLLRNRHQLQLPSCLSAVNGSVSLLRTTQRGLS